MVDTLVLGTSAAMREGSSPFIRTKIILDRIVLFNFAKFYLHFFFDYYSVADF